MAEVSDSPAETAVCADPVRTALLEAAVEVDAYLHKEGSPPIWYQAVDLIHERAGSLWVEGDDGNYGGYVCRSCGRSVEDGPCGKDRANA